MGARADFVLEPSYPLILLAKLVIFCLLTLLNMLWGILMDTLLIKMKLNWNVSVLFNTLSCLVSLSDTQFKKRSDGVIILSPN